jgi:hypothetical protein
MNLVFSPLISLAKYAALLESVKTKDQIDSILVDIRRQWVTSIFYLPAVGELEESIVLLDNVHTQPFDAFKQTPGRAKVFTLSQYGFYLFIIKISIHFTRVQEDVHRFPSRRA